MRRTIVAAAVAALAVAPLWAQAQNPPQSPALPGAPIVAWTYTVQPGDTFRDIARRWGVTMEMLGAANAIPSPYIIRVGQVLKRPSPASLPPSAPPPAVPPRPVSRPAPAPRPEPVARPAPTIRPAPAPHAREAGAPDMSWPVSGAVLSRFGAAIPAGSIAGGTRNRGIDLAAYAGLTVHAAAAGTVIFAGNEPERFGQLVVIDHGQGWATAYAYLGSMRVKEGDVVKRRQAIATIGKSGEARRPTLHFELRRDNDPRDPLAYLPVRF